LVTQQGLRSSLAPAAEHFHAALPQPPPALPCSETSLACCQATC
jgi:hypothetical protein